MIFRKTRKNKKTEIYPDEIFIDSQNLPQFDLHQFEGRIERPISKKTFFFFSLFFILIIGFFLLKIFDLGVMNGEVYAEISRDNSLRNELIIAPRGLIYDRNGVKLAWNSVKGEGEDFSKREYIQSSGFAHLLGFLKYPAKDSSGFYYREEYEPEGGMESYFNDKIAGQNGLKIAETDAHGNIISGSVLDKPVEGEKIFISIDSGIQNKMHEAITKTAAEVGFKGGAGVIMDVNSGEIIAMASSPEFDLNVLNEGSDEELISSYFNDSTNPFLDRVFSGLYAPGSIVKPFVAFGALEEGIITPEKEILSTGQLVVPNPYFPDKPSIFKDWKAHGLVDMRRALAVSSDVYFYQVGGGFGSQKGLGIAKLNEYFKKFGFSEPVDVGIPNEEAGLIPNPEWKMEIFGEDWRLGDTYNTAIGQYGMQVTPIQVVRAVAAVANEGYLVSPVFLKQATSTSVILDRSKDVQEKNPEHWKIVKEGMRMSVTEGTASGLSVPGIKIAGKTGTAEIGAAKAHVNSWSIGFFPYENPKYAFAVVMERGPAKNLIGATYVMRQVMDYIIANAPEYIK